ncbi:hypothetical protein EJ05DRAFT_503828 [Pseudovirgaria hyperparasitica]|uniref:NADH dehydrogenase [ubiquinone] 1 alpha subcomplex subunit 1 n=1 Tax=Pseudovirgaria hyperparasitica TaxID=470096 RepID=A0A6A6VXI6_9PEZI|nr:uncharacterized protein EJ05DRAFT_503828 [Pseudovirgaria hyperparasitica]KAF2754885.1 hypothetical protein EJ05DRAFT_503828 [Pseudovirgaria hyperparasitica]
MPVPFEALIPYGIIVGMFGITGAGLNWLRYTQNGGKRPRRTLDQWDRQSTTFSNLKYQLMERDKRLTGFMRGQTDKPHAPDGFELNNPWKLERRIY